MKKILAKSQWKESRNTRKPISSQGLAGGPMPSSSRIGQPTSPFGQPLAPVNRFRAPVIDVARKTAGTYGQRSTASFQSINLTRCLANKLQAGMDLNGSMEYRLTWKKSVIESGRLIYRLRAMARRSSDRGFGGWPAPRAADGEGGIEPPGKTGRKLQTIAGWAQPSARDWKSESATDQFNAKRDAHPRGKPLSYQATGAIMKLSGVTSEQQEKDGCHGVLNPVFSLWLQGYPAGWLSLERSATV